MDLKDDNDCAGFEDENIVFKAYQVKLDRFLSVEQMIMMDFKLWVQNIV